VLQELRELYAYRELIKNLVIRDLKVRYRNSFLGFLWSLGNPLLMMIVFTVVFTVLLPSRIDRFPLFVLCAILPWNFFSAAIAGAAHSVTSASSLVKKVYFPREVLPLSVVLANLVNFLLAFIVLIGMVLLYQVPLGPSSLLLPVIITIQTAFTLGIGFILAAINVYYRDTTVIMDVILMAWFFMTPIFYPIEALPAQYVLAGFTLDVRRLMYIFNPMASVIASYRDILYHAARPGFDFLLRTALTAFLVMIIGYLFYDRLSRFFGEEL